MLLCNTPGKHTFYIIYSKVVFDITIEEETTDWYTENNDTSEKQEFVFFLHEMTELLCCGMARAAEDFNTASCLQIGSVENVDLTDYEKATMNMSDYIKDLNKTIRNKTPCTTKTIFFTSDSSIKKVHIANPQAVTVTPSTGGGPQAIPKKEHRQSATTSAWTEPAWVEQADGYKAEKRKVPEFNKEKSKRHGYFLDKPYFECVLEENITNIYCADYNIYCRYCEPTKGCNKRHVNYYCFKQNKKTDQCEYVLANKDSTVFNTTEARDLPS